MPTAAHVWRAYAFAGLFLLAASFSATSSAAARDLRALAEVVTPAYIAMNFAVVCATIVPQFLAQTSGPHGIALKYAEHVKDEAIAALTYQESLVVLRAAANAARATSLQTVRQFKSADPREESAKLQAWCETDAKTFIHAFIVRHDNDHDAMMQRIEDAKR